MSLLRVYRRTFLKIKIKTEFQTKLTRKRPLSNCFGYLVKSVALKPELIRVRKGENKRNLKFSRQCRKIPRWPQSPAFGGDIMFLTVKHLIQHGCSNFYLCNLIVIIIIFKFFKLSVKLNTLYSLIVLVSCQRYNILVETVVKPSTSRLKKITGKS